MKNILLTIALVGFGSCTFAQTETTPANQVLKFETISHDFGTVYEGTMATYDFKFTNTGQAPIVLSNVQASCGCTTPKWPREPIAPGQNAVITAQYNSAGRPGSFHKTISVYSDAGNYTLTITGNVVQKPEKPKSPVIVN
ncbi:MAG: hypothetical protein RLZZ370_429 [Bacteroidota bacterium]|jgi:hypothetical protein